MYSKDEAKALREKFWNEFKSWSGRKRTKAGKPGRWVMNDTGIKQLKLKFHFDNNMAQAGIEIDTRNLDKRITLWDKLEQLRKVLTEIVDFPLIWELEYKVTDDKTTSRIYAQLNDVNIYNTNDWKKVKQFLYDRMMLIEDFYTEYKDALKYN